MKKEEVSALYARVSSDKQAKDKTINNQVAALKEKIRPGANLQIDRQPLKSKPLYVYFASAWCLLKVSRLGVFPRVSKNG